MDKTRINLALLLPQVPDERDACVNRLITRMEDRKGIDKIHIVPEKDGNKAQLCFHYDASLISVQEVENMAAAAGAELTQQYGHLLVEVTGIRQPRHARLVESELKGTPAVLSASVSGTGFIQLEYDRQEADEQKMLLKIRGMDLRVKNVEDFLHESEVSHNHGGEKHDHEGHDHHDHKHDHAGHKHDHAGHNHDHAHGGIFGEKTELYFSIICGAFLATGFGLSFVHTLSPHIPIGLYIIAYFFGGFYTTKEAIEGISQGDFEIDFLMLVAAVGAAILGQWAEGALLLFLFSFGHSLEHYAMEKARKSIAALADLAPKTALLKTGPDVKEVPIETLKAGDIIMVKPNSKIAADGVVVRGKSSVNQAPITGESIPVDKQPVPDAGFDPAKVDGLDAAYKVFSGSINGSDTLEVSVSRVAADSTIARLVKLVNEAQTQKSPTQQFTDKIEKYYVPGVLILVGALLFAFLVIHEPFSASFYRAMSVLVAASPCALAISTPSAVLSGVARAARAGVLVKGGRPLEELGSLTAIAFDKTGTLTEGKPRLTGVYPLNGLSEGDLLETVVAVEKLSDHPLAAAIVKGGLEKLGKDVAPASDLQSVSGRGLKATYRNAPVLIGNQELFSDGGSLLPGDIRKQADALEAQGHTTMLVQQNGSFTGIITVMDTARSDAKETLLRLKKAGIRKMVMLTGDNQAVAEAIARETGLTDAWGNLLPEQKVAAIEKLKASEKKVAMVGDGVNDAPAMARSTVGIAMGAAGSDVALETADIALMADKLSNLPFAIGLSKKAHGIIRQNLVISLGMVAILVPLTISGMATIGPAVIGHEGSTLIVVFNALRLLAYKERSR